MTISDDTYEINLTPTDEEGVISISISYFDKLSHPKIKKKNLIIDFNNDFIVQGNILNFIVDYYNPSREVKKK